MHLAIEERMRYQMLLNVSEVAKVRGEVVVVIHGWHQSSWVRHRFSCHYNLTFLPGLVCCSLLLIDCQISLKPLIYFNT